MAVLHIQTVCFCARIYSIRGKKERKGTNNTAGDEEKGKTHAQHHLVPLLSSLCLSPRSRSRFDALLEKPFGDTIDDISLTQLWSCCRFPGASVEKGPNNHMQRRVFGRIAFCLPRRGKQGIKKASGCEKALLPIGCSALFCPSARTKIHGFA